MTIATVLVSILFLSRLSLLVVFLVLMGGNVTTTALIVALLAVVRGFMIILDLITIVGALKKIKTIMIIWIGFSVLNIAVDVYRCITISERNEITLGQGYGYDSLKRGVEMLINISFFRSDLP